MTEHEDLLIRLAIREGSAIDPLLVDPGRNLTASHLDPKTHALARVAALVAIDAATPSYLDPVDDAREAGATDDEIVGTLVAVLTIVGAPRVVSAAPKLGLALGLDVAEALEGLDEAAR